MKTRTITKEETVYTCEECGEESTCKSYILGHKQKHEIERCQHVNTTLSIRLLADVHMGISTQLGIIEECSDCRCTVSKTAVTSDPFLSSYDYLTICNSNHNFIRELADLMTKYLKVS